MTNASADLSASDIPTDECWLHEPAMQIKLAQADEWMRNNPAKETNLEALKLTLGH